MAKYIFSYHQPAGYVPRTDSEATAAWQSFFEGIAAHVADPGQPVFDRRTVGETGPGTQLGGYTIINAESLEAAVQLTKGCPSVQHGGGVQVGELGEVPPAVTQRLREGAARR